MDAKTMRHNHPGKYWSRTPKGRVTYKNRPIHNHDKELGYKELWRKYRIRKHADDDGDGVPNYKDCRPWDRRRQHEQSLFHAGDEPPSEIIKRGDNVYGFSNIEDAEGWRKKYGYKKIWRYQASNYVLDPQQYERESEAGKRLSDDEYIANRITEEEEVEYEE